MNQVSFYFCACIPSYVHEGVYLLKVKHFLSLFFHLEALEASLRTLPSHFILYYSHFSSSFNAALVYYWEKVMVAIKRFHFISFDIYSCVLKLMLDQ